MKKAYTLQDILAFGRYKGQKLGRVITNDAHYIQWCITNVSDFSMDEPAWDYAISMDASFETFKPKSSPRVDELACAPYADGIEVLLYNPWSKKMFEHALAMAEDAKIYSISPKQNRYQAIQLHIQF